MRRKELGFMCIRNCSIKSLAILTLLISSCQTTPRPPEIVRTVTPRVPVVIGKIKVKTPSIPGGVAVNTRTGYVYIANAQEIVVLNGVDTIKEIQTGGGDAKSIAVDEAKGLVYVVNSDNDNVTVIRDTEVLGIVPTVGKSPRGVAVEPRSGFAYITSGYKGRPLRDIEGNILVISGTQVIDNIKLGQVFAESVVADPLGLVYVGANKKVLVFKGLREIARHELEVGVDSLDVNPRTGEVYALTHQTLYRFQGGKLIDSVFLVEDMGNVSQIRVNPTSGAIYIPHTGYVLGEARLLVVREMKVIDDIKVGALATLGIDALYGNVYVGNHTGRGKDVGTVMVVHDTKVLATYRMEWFPYSIGVNPANGWGYVFDGSTITVLGYPQNKLTVPAQTETIPVTPKTPPAPAVYP
jgi:YVTN family beta-propeller protein